MNGKMWLLTGLLSAVLLLAGCAQNEPEKVTVNLSEVRTQAGAAEEVVEIGEKLFIAQTNDIYLNAPDYLGKTIKYEGLYQSYDYNDETFAYVIRYGPGCCGDDGNAGFQVVWEGDAPDQNDWVEAVGVLEEYEMDGWSYLQVRLTSLTVKEERGAEFVAA